MLSDEEREAIEKIKRFNQYNWEMNNLKGKEFAKPYFESLDTLLNLIEKQSKEIEELKQNIHLKEVYVLKTNDYIKGTNIEDELCNKKWEDKIKAEIEELQEDIKYSANPLSIDNSKFGIKVLQSLLEKE